MKITVLSKMFNEEDLLPIFLNHYSFADEIVIYLDQHSSDNSRHIINACPKAKIVWGEGDGKLNDLECVNALNQIAFNCKSDWLIYADADEFVFPEGFANPREVLRKADGNLIYSHMWDIFKHESEAELDLNNLSILQRRHGNPNIIYECIKPNIIKPEIEITWGVGCHEFYDNPKIIKSSVKFCGAHWQSADLDLACKRRIKGVKERVSQTNLDNGWAFHNFNVTREEIAALMEAHKNDPQLF
jgi:glycosyltransferase involved in cell wall biosynthesis